MGLRIVLHVMVPMYVAECVVCDWMVVCGGVWWCDGVVGVVVCVVGVVYLMMMTWECVALCVLLSLYMGTSSQHTHIHTHTHTHTHR